MAIQNQLRQGDVLLHPITAIPAKAKPVKKGKHVVLAEGEVTGHAHRIQASKKLKTYSDGSMLYLEVVAPVALQHEEHSELTIQPGCYEVRRQVEVWLDEVRQVAD